MLQRVFAGVSRFLRWWGRELAGLVPGSPRAATAGRGTRTVVSLGRTSVAIVEERGRTSRVLAAADVGPSRPITDALSILDGQELREPVVIRVARDACFSRALHIPETAASDAASVAALDLERATPFRAADVMTAVVPDTKAAAPAGRIAIRQLVLKRDTVRPVIAALEARGRVVTFIDSWADDGVNPLGVDFLAAPGTAVKAGMSRIMRIDRVLAAASAVGALAAMTIVAVKYDNALAVLELESAAARRGAAAVGQQISRAEAALADIERLAGVRGRRPPVVAVIEEVTRLLPDGAYLTELTLEGDQLDLTGFAKSAAPLLEIFERAPLFMDARFSAPSRLDTREDRERFAMRVRLRAPATASGREPAPAIKPASKG